MKKIINIVEDEKDLNELVKRYLEKEGYTVYSYLTFDEAYSHLDDYVDLWILDIMLDDKSGFDLIEEIRNHNANILHHLCVLAPAMQKDDISAAVTIFFIMDIYSINSDIAHSYACFFSFVRLGLKLRVILKTTPSSMFSPVTR